MKMVKLSSQKSWRNYSYYNHQILKDRDLVESVYSPHQFRLHTATGKENLQCKYLLAEELMILEHLEKTKKKSIIQLLGGASLYLEILSAPWIRWWEA